MPPRIASLGLAGNLLEEAGSKLRSGQLVAFPTETVYGLGANALDAKAVAGIFQAKGRPLTDPVIVHVLQWSHARRLLHPDPKRHRIAQALTDKFWPGPLTLILPASTQNTTETEAIPDIVTAGTGFVGVRSPNHPIARALIDAAKIPIAAPSANRFGHTSPTLPEHVVVDFPNEDFLVIDGGACSVGIESTVAKIEEEGHITILRRGAITSQDMSSCLSSAGISVDISVVSRAVKEHVAQEAPGQLLTHYAPDVEAFLLQGENAKEQPTSVSRQIPFSDSILIDYGAKYDHMKSKFKAYYDLSEKKNADEAALNLFKTLRWTETIEGAVAVILPDLSQSNAHSSDEASLAVHDRIFRASSGKQCHFDTDAETILT